jgi:Zn-dependent protease with chaperone function
MEKVLGLSVLAAPLKRTASSALEILVTPSMAWQRLRVPWVTYVVLLLAVLGIARFGRFHAMPPSEAWLLFGGVGISLGLLVGWLLPLAEQWMESRGAWPSPAWTQELAELAEGAENAEGVKGDEVAEGIDGTALPFPGATPAQSTPEVWICPGPRRGIPGRIRLTGSETRPRIWVDQALALKMSPVASRLALAHEWGHLVSGHLSRQRLQNRLYFAFLGLFCGFWACFAQGFSRGWMAPSFQFGWLAALAGGGLGWVLWSQIRLLFQPILFFLNWRREWQADAVAFKNLGKAAYLAGIQDLRSYFAPNFPTTRARRLGLLQQSHPPWEMRLDPASYSVLPLPLLWKRLWAISGDSSQSKNT